MANITLTIPDGVLTRVIDGFARANNYRSTVFDENHVEIPNPETKAQYCKRMLIAYIKASVLRAERDAAVDAVSATVSSDVDAINIT